MHRHFEDLLEKLRSNLIKMGSLVDSQLDLAFRALHDGDVGETEKVYESEKKVNQFDNLLDQQVDEIMALEQPVATDLRLVVSAIKINHELERIGDVAVNIAQRVEPLKNYHGFVRATAILEMGDVARRMVHDSIDSFIHADAELARRICKEDDVVDEMNRQKFHFVIGEMKKNPDFVEPGAHLIVALKHIERIADHATNIAEDVVFLVDAKIIKHHAADNG
ncbi:MAG: phosphate signaling complex protein PhoU [Bacteroidetes bacterium]|jgi:phosphate transport system protein|nr:phosphate signaling complex protein PhoU [Bacteroidota bacterium]MCL5034286.1 phosphate signaling complex protein PhoU [Bacteroidota bacterium]